MESPVFFAMAALWLLSDYTWQASSVALVLLFEAHYFQRSFIFPAMMRGESKMPIGIMILGMVFNTLNALMQGGWIFYFAPRMGYYDGWLSKPYFWIGAAIFAAGFFINLQSDHIIRHLRKPGDTRHYIRAGHVPLCVVGQLLRRSDRVGGLCHSVVVVGGCGVRVVDAGQSGTALGIALQALRAGVRRGVHVARPQENNTVHLLIQI